MITCNCVTGNLTHPIASSLKDGCLTHISEMNLWTAGQWTDPESRSDFTWKVASGVQPMKYTNWYLGDTRRPSSGPVRPCLMLSLDRYHIYSWNDMPCDTKMCFVCQLEG